jgi:ubiquinone/menaquinone biosynthesis C-methylase UbiE
MDARAIARHPGLRHRVIGTGEQLPFEDNAFDLVTANMVIEHVEAPARLFEEIGRILGITRERVRQLEAEALRRLAERREIAAIKAA